MVFEPDIAIPPGKTLAENLDYLDMTQVELAKRTGLSIKSINEIIKGKAPITYTTAFKLQMAMNIPASFWNNLERKYQETLVRLKEQEALGNEVNFAKKYTCYQELSNFGFVNPTGSWNDRVQQLKLFFRVNSLSTVQEIKPIVFRKSPGRINKENIAAWLRCGEIISQNIDIPPLDKTGIKKRLTDIKKLTRCPANFGRDLRHICAEYGIKLVYFPHFKETKINGATRWYQGSPLIQLTVRWKYSDIFWFTFFHELGHVLLHGKKDNFLNFKDSKDTVKEKEENEADQFASNTLIPHSKYQEFIRSGRFTYNSIRSFADNIGVGQSIVAGRLAHDKHVDWSYIQKIRTRLELVPTQSD